MTSLIIIQGTFDESTAAGKPGKEFDSSRAKNKPFEFILGQGSVIKGWDQGIVDMCIGEKRSLVVPPELGYGSKGSGKIPGDATLRFEIECLNVRDSSPGSLLPDRNVFKEIDKDDDWLISIDELMEFHVRKFGNKPIPQGLWERYDKNRDGIVDWEEFDGPKGTEGPPPKKSKQKKEEL